MDRFKREFDALSPEEQAVLRREAIKNIPEEEKQRLRNSGRVSHQWTGNLQQAAADARKARPLFPGKTTESVNDFFDQHGERFHKMLLAQNIYGISLGEGIAQGGGRNQGEYLQSLLNTGLWMYYQLCRWFDLGMPVLRPTLDLSVMLVNTEYKIGVSEVKLPWDVYAVAIPVGLTKSAYARIQVAWMIRHQAPLLRSPAEQAAARTAARSGERVNLPEEHTAFEIKADFHEVPPGGDPGDFVTLTDLLDVEAGLRQISNEEVRSQPWLEEAFDEVHGVPEDVDPSQRERWLDHVSRVVIGAGIYAVDPANRSDYVRRRNPLAKSRRTKPGQQPWREPTEWIIGKAISIPREMRDATVEATGPSRVGWRVKNRFVVKGHPRNQACGPGMLEHRTIWIKPYWKGPEHGPALQRCYDEDAVDMTDAAVPVEEAEG